MNKLCVIIACLCLCGCSVERLRTLNAEGLMISGNDPSAQAAQFLDGESWVMQGGLVPSSIQSDEDGMIAASNALQQAAMLKLMDDLTLGMSAGTDIFAKGIRYTANPDGTKTLDIAEAGSNASEPTAAYVALVSEYMQAFVSASADVRQESIAAIQAQREATGDVIGALKVGLDILKGGL